MSSLFRHNKMWSDLRYAICEMRSASRTDTDEFWIRDADEWCLMNDECIRNRPPLVPCRIFIRRLFGAICGLNQRAKSFATARSSSLIVVRIICIPNTPESILNLTCMRNTRPMVARSDLEWSWVTYAIWVSQTIRTVSESPLRAKHAANNSGHIEDPKHIWMSYKSNMDPKSAAASYAEWTVVGQSDLGHRRLQLISKSDEIQSSSSTPWE
jgi:hypothetical protein